jgi:hypothetical protein
VVIFKLLHYKKLFSFICHNTQEDSFSTVFQ